MVDFEAALSRSAELDLAERWLEAAAVIKQALESPELATHPERDWLRAALCMHLGNALTTGRDMDGAIAAYYESIAYARQASDRDNWAGSAFNLGAALEGWGRLNESLAAFREARRVHPAASTRESIVRVRLKLMRPDAPGRRRP